VGSRLIAAAVEKAHKASIARALSHAHEYAVLSRPTLAAVILILRVRSTSW
jgi:hypothetical protein